MRIVLDDPSELDPPVHRGDLIMHLYGVRHEHLGSEVQYTKRFLKSIGASPFDPAWRMKGMIIRYEDMNGQPWPVVLWYGDEEPRMVHPNNVATGLVANID